MCVDNISRNPTSEKPFFIMIQKYKTQTSKIEIYIYLMAEFSSCLEMLRNYTVLQICRVFPVQYPSNIFIQSEPHISTNKTFYTTAIFSYRTKLRCPLSAFFSFLLVSSGGHSITSLISGVGRKNKDRFRVSGRSKTR